MSKLDLFEGLQTKWCGLWYDPHNGGFSSTAFRLSDRPNYVFCIKDSNSPTFSELTIEEDEDAKSCYFDEDNGCYYTGDDERLYTYEEVQYAIDRATEDAQRGYTDNIVRDYL